MLIAWWCPFLFIFQEQYFNYFQGHPGGWVDSKTKISKNLAGIFPIVRRHLDACIS